ncbi:glucose 1-dehydrogenase [Candidimonas sp. SYP-B2681]|uniref:SDR family NAD(P)-dependent oxidoreductase n=1 Tax=Candidimonas sp. SYP-B2681 TaxID=2497686 RepID=UPI000F883085|nr:glucose 1-dehydrogenase [Candidimonas sp. SYP-B2681]RTZ45463.1 glucose 1-dehydrogenase [Candidimonas sp. SYP-B2681]
MSLKINHAEPLLTDQVVLIVGAGAGIGRAAAFTAAREGALLSVADINMENAKSTALQITQAGGKAIAIKVDIASPDEVDAMVADTVAHYGRLDHALNNAGVTQWQCGAEGMKVGEASIEAFDRVVGVNFRGTWLSMRAELAQMVEQGGGTIVNTSSVTAMVGRNGSGIYAATKHAIVGLSRSAAIEYAQANIRVNSLCPGFTNTELVKSSIARRGDALLESVPMRRLAEPEEIAEMAVWLMSDRARYVTGTEMVVDGGFMAG